MGLLSRFLGRRDSLDTRLAVKSLEHVDDFQFLSVQQPFGEQRVRDFVDAYIAESRNPGHTMKSGKFLLATPSGVQYAVLACELEGMATLDENGGPATPVALRLERGKYGRPDRFLIDLNKEKKPSKKKIIGRRLFEQIQLARTEERYNPHTEYVDMHLKRGALSLHYQGNVQPRTQHTTDAELMYKDDEHGVYAELHYRMIIVPQEMNGTIPLRVQRVQLFAHIHDQEVDERGQTRTVATVVDVSWKDKYYCKVNVIHRYADKDIDFYINKDFEQLLRDKDGIKIRKGIDYSKTVGAFSDVIAYANRKQSKKLSKLCTNTGLVVCK
jgi:hypothetical protein